MKKRPGIISFFGILDLLSASFAIFVTIGSLFPGFIEHLNITKMTLPFYANDIISVMLYIFQIVVAYGLLKLEKWGYWLTLAYQLFFVIVYVIGYLLNKNPLFVTNVTIPFLEIIFILPTKKYFNEEKVARN